MRHLWILNHYAQEPSGAGGTRHYGLARHLMKHGWKTSIIAASTELNTGNQRLAKGERLRLVDYDGVTFLWLKTPRYRGNGWGRMFNMLTYSVQALTRSSSMQLMPPDVIIGSSVHPFAAASGALLARRFRVPFIFEVRDLWPQTLIDMGRLSAHGLVTRVLQRLELLLYRRANRIIVLLPKAGDYIVPLGIKPEKIVWIPNGVELDGYPEPPPPVGTENFTLMYFGAHGQANGLDNLIQAMAILQERPNASNIRLHLIGDGPCKSDLKHLARKLQLRNVTFFDSVPKSEIPILARNADGFVFNLIDAPVFKYGISSNKLFDFMAAARPVLFCCSAVNNPVAEAGAGITVPPENPAALADAILQLASLSPADRERMGRAGRHHVEQHYSYEKRAARLAALLNECCEEAR